MRRSWVMLCVGGCFFLLLWSLSGVTGPMFRMDGYSVGTERGVCVSSSPASQVVWEISGKTQGLFVEVGPREACLTNTLGLEQKGWSGLLVESSKNACTDLGRLTRRAWRLCGCLGQVVSRNCFDPVAALSVINTSHIDYFSVGDVGGSELAFLQSMQPLMTMFTVDVWSVPYRVGGEEGTNVSIQSETNLNKTRDFFRALGYAEWGFVSNKLGDLVSADSGTEVVFVRREMLHRISVVVPAIQDNVDAGELELLLASIDAQIVLPYEVVFVITGITDQNCAAVKAEIADPNRLYILRVFCYNALANQATARNRGLDLARGEWVSFIDADDPMHPHRLEVLASYIRKLPELQLFLHAYSERVEYVPPVEEVDGVALFNAVQATQGRQIHILDNLMNSQASVRRNTGQLVRFRESSQYFRAEDSYFVRDVIEKIGKVGPAMAFFNSSLSFHQSRGAKQKAIAELKEKKRLRKQSEKGR